MKTFNRRDEGFALIITISLMAFLVLLLVTLTTMTRVETQLASNSQQMHIARENARMALGVAIGQLQRYAGVDEVITARADIEGTGPVNNYNPYWTGVWDNQGTGFSVLTWLVSGNEDPANPLHFTPTMFDYDPTQPGIYRTPSGAPSPLGSSSGAGVRMVGHGTGFPNPTATPSNSIMEGVVAPLVPIRAPNNAYPGLAGTPVIGHYAYWVADQGVKASIGKVERHLEANTAPLTQLWSYGPTSDATRQILRQLMPQRFGHSALFSNSVTIENDPLYMLRLAHVQSLHQIREALNPNFAAQYDDYSGSQNDALRTNFHDITHFNMGVLAGTTGNGLKRDLSSYVPPVSPPGGPPSVANGNPPAAVVGITDFMTVRPFAASSTRIDYEMVAPTGLVAGQPSLKIAPVLSEVLFNYLVWADATRVLQVQLDVELELWNPYNVSLTAEDLFLMIEDLSNTSNLVEVYDANGNLHGEIDLEASLLPALAAFTFSTGNMPPGSIRTISFSSSDVAVPTPAQGPGGPLDPLPPPVGLPRPPPDEWRLENNSFAALEVTMRLVDPALTPLTSPRLSRFVLNHFDALETDPIPAADPPTPRFGFYLRMRDGNDDPNWLTYYNPVGFTLIDDDDNTAASRDPDRDPFETERDLEAAKTMTLNSIVPSELLLPANTITLFELPTQEVVNPGSLQHVYYHRSPAYALGSPWGGAVNNFFDNYFISTIPQDNLWLVSPLAPTQFPVPHTGMIPSFNEANNYDPAAESLAIPAEGFQSPESARHLLLQGTFNINSTSVNAWESILSSLNIVRNPHNADDSDWRFGVSGSAPLQNAFFRYSQTGDMLTNYSTATSDLETLGYAYQQGVRELTAADITFIAQSIVDDLRNQGQPFDSLAAFVNSGIVQDAIDLSGVNASIPPYAPAFLSQADVISVLAPFMLARSDTFLVRAYGDAMNPVTGEQEGRAWCEAIVQRMPAPFDSRAIPNDVMNPGNGSFGQFGRKYEVIYFRWLDSSEL